MTKDNQEPEHFGRRSIRLKSYDYSLPGGYYVTVVTQLRQNFFGEIRNQEMFLNDAGQMVHATWQSLPGRFPNVEIDVFQVMPNHFHGILILHDMSVGAGLVPALHDQTRAPVGAGLVPAHDDQTQAPVGAGLVPAHDDQTRAPVGAGLVPAHDDQTRATIKVAPTLGQIIGAFKSITTHEYILGVENMGWPQFYKRLWQRNYYEHILRDQADYEQKAGYILDNPANWEKDDENPQSTAGNPIAPK
jgi:putative transposase